MTSTPIYPEYPCITEAAITNFLPTYLMAKRHKKTGLMYFCKTTKSDPIKYLGSGTRWQRHIKKHGKEHVETIWCQRFDDILLLVEFALGFSKDADIVASKEWANLIPENGLDGGMMTTEIRKRISITKTGVKVPNLTIAMEKMWKKAKSEGKKPQGGKAVKQWEIKLPNDTIITIVNLANWCRENGIHFDLVKRTLKRGTPVAYGPNKGLQLLSVNFVTCKQEN